MRVANAVHKKKHKSSEHVDATTAALSRKQSWRRVEGGARPNWKSLDSGFFTDGMEFDQSRLTAWLQLYIPAPGSKKGMWAWRKIRTNGFIVMMQRQTGDDNPDEICMEDILGLLCTHPVAKETKENEVTRPHEKAAYFRRTNLHASEDASDIHSLVASAEAEYLSGSASRAGGAPVPLLDFELTERDFAVLTTKMGYYRGMPIIFRASCEDEKDQWVETLRRIIKFESASHLAPLSAFGKLRRQVFRLYTAPPCQIGVAGLICINFLMNIIEAQTSDPVVTDLLEASDLLFTAIFCIELFINMFATLVWNFLSDPWNYFDTVVVFVGLVGIFVPDMPGGNILKLMRTFRVFRLFKRVPSLKHLVGSIFKAVPAMANAFLLQAILTCIYAILCTRFFGVLECQHSEEPGTENSNSTSTNTSATYTEKSRATYTENSNCEFNEYFGDFFGSMFSLWQMMTGDWSTIVRAMFIPSGMPGGVALFFVSYQLLITFTMINVVVCVLVNEFCGGASDSEETSNDLAPLFNAVERFRENNTSRLKSLLEDSLACHDIDAFNDMMHQIWHSICRFAEVADPDKSDTAITFEELAMGLRELPYCPPVIFKWQDWHELVETTELCNSQGLLSRAGFNDMVQGAIMKYGKHNLQVAMKLSCNGTSDDQWSDETIRAYLYGLKAKAICIAENAHRQEMEVLRRWNQESEEKPDSEIFLNMRTLVWEFNQMHRRFNTIEVSARTSVHARRQKQECASIRGATPEDAQVAVLSTRRACLFAACVHEYCSVRVCGHAIFSTSCIRACASAWRTLAVLSLWALDRN